MFSLFCSLACFDFVKEFIDLKGAEMLFCYNYEFIHCRQGNKNSIMRFSVTSGFVISCRSALTPNYI